MGIYLAEQTVVFMQSIIVGAVLGAIYDVFRISRVAVNTPPAVIFAEDVLFFFICAVVTFFFGLRAMDGMLRVFLIIGELLGAVLYFFTFGRIVMAASKKIIGAIKAIGRFILKWILKPIWRLIYHITAIIMRPFAFLGRLFKKILQNIKYRLKTRYKVLYNQVTGIFPVRRPSKGRKRHRNGKTQKRQT